eukprot:11182849-Lingulodinium_polyedra.AAC.1
MAWPPARTTPKPTAPDSPTTPTTNARASAAPAIYIPAHHGQRQRVTSTASATPNLRPKRRRGPTISSKWGGGLATSPRGN